MSWGDWKRSLGINKTGQRTRRELGSFGQRILGDEAYQQVTRLGDEITETATDVTEQTDEFLNNPLSWATRTLLPDVAGDVVDWAKNGIDSLIGRGIYDDPAAAAEGAPQGTMPDLAAARARLAARKPRFGRASSILSDRPASPLGYTGSASISNVSLGA